MPGLSLCMIVKNEADCIERCLNSVKHVADEMIIVDTGSSDDTIDLCRAAGAAVYSYEWHDNFASARNYGLERATGDWILWLDADEELDKDDAVKLRELISREEADLFSIQLINYYGEQADDFHILQMAHPRIFRNRMGFRFVNPIHETLNIPEVLNTPELQQRIVLAPIKVHHYGYLDPVVDAKQKAERNLSLLLKQMNAEDKNPWIYYHIASEYYRIKQYQHSFQYVNQAIVLFLSEGMTPPSLLYKLKYSILLSLGSFRGAYPAIEKAICLYPDYVDLHFYKGLLLYFLGKTEKAIEAFDRCLELGDDQWSHLTQKGLGSFQAWYYKGLCLEQVNRQEAIQCYRQALLLYPDFEEAVQALARLQKTE